MKLKKILKDCEDKIMERNFKSKKEIDENGAKKIKLNDDEIKSSNTMKENKESKVKENRKAETIKIKECRENKENGAKENIKNEKAKIVEIKENEKNKESKAKENKKGKKHKIIETEENKINKGAEFMRKDKIGERNKGKKQIEQNKRETKTIEVNVGFAVLKIVAIILIISLITAQTVRTIIGTKENISETEQEGIALLAEIDIEYILSDDETYVTVTITSDYAITQIEASEEDYDENLEEDDYTFTIEEDWTETDDGLVWSKEFTENIDKAYRLTFEDETSVVEEVIIEDFLDSEEENNTESGDIEEDDEEIGDSTEEIFYSNIDPSSDEGVSAISDDAEDTRTVKYLVLNSSRNRETERNHDPDAKLIQLQRPKHLHKHRVRHDGGTF